jgi:hypothetical protein
MAGWSTPARGNTHSLEPLRQRSKSREGEIACSETTAFPQRRYQLRTDFAFAASMVTLTGEVWRLFHCCTLRAAVHIASFYLASAGRMGTLSGCRDILAHGRFPFLQTRIPIELKSVGGQTDSWSESLYANRLVRFIMGFPGLPALLFPCGQTRRFGHL